MLRSFFGFHLIINLLKMLLLSLIRNLIAAWSYRNFVFCSFCSEKNLEEYTEYLYIFRLLASPFLQLEYGPKFNCTSIWNCPAFIIRRSLMCWLELVLLLSLLAPLAAAVLLRATHFCFMWYLFLFSFLFYWQNIVTFYSVHSITWSVFHFRIFLWK